MKNWFKKHAVTIVLIAVLVIGAGLLIYPSFSNYWNNYWQSRAIVDYAQVVATLDEDVYEEIWQNAVEYNKRLAETGVIWQPTEEELADYESQLHVNDSGNMGYIEIPKINVHLPMYHGTSDEVLQTSIGHIVGTSLPVGGIGSHCVLSGHRGLPSARLFSDLDKLTEGDVFILTTLDQTLTYEVDQIRIVEPTDLSNLAIDPDMDYCTLVTCTPYGINTHRLLVRGHRIANAQETNIRIIADALLIEPMFVAPVIAVPVLILLVIWMLFMTSGFHKRRKEARAKRNERRERVEEIREFRRDARR